MPVLGCAYWFTRPPELVWWRSPPIFDTQRRMRVLVPNGWRYKSERIFETEPLQTICDAYTFEPIDQRPALLRTLLPYEDKISLVVTCVQMEKSYGSGPYMSDVSVRYNSKWQFSKRLVQRDNPP